MARFWGGLFAAMLLAAAHAADAETTVLRVDGYIEQSNDALGQISFKLQQVDQRFVIARAKIADPDAVLQALKDSYDKSVSLTVRYDPETATFELGSNIPSYVVRQLVFDGKTVDADETTPPRRAEGLPAWEQAEFALGRAIAYAGAGKTELARPLLDKAIATSKLRTGLKALALKNRNQLIEEDALAQLPAGEARDRTLVAALADARAWQALAPDDEHAAMRVAWNLRELGAYDEAEAVCKDALTRWPDAAYMIWRAIAALHRDGGNPALALDDLAKLAAVPGAADSMPYHYHRGWTLEEMGRWDEAIADFTEGLKFQPDYDGAYWRRACAYAETGRLGEALADFRTATKYRAAYMENFPPTPGSTFDNQRYRSVEQTVTDALAKDGHQRITGLCRGYWDWGDTPRPRSKLLPPKP